MPRLWAGMSLQKQKAGLQLPAFLFCCEFAHNLTADSPGRANLRRAEDYVAIQFAAVAVFEGKATTFDIEGAFPLYFELKSAESVF